MQYGVHPGPDSLLEPLALIAAAALVGGALLVVTRLILTRTRGRRARRRRMRAAATAELRARAMMSELCPHGWHAQISMSAGVGDPDGPLFDRAGSGVALHWAELSRDAGRPAVVRCVWGDTIAEALEAMVADRRTDETLEQIEHRAVADGATWPDA